MRQVDFFECSSDVMHQVFRVFDADGEANEIFGNAEFEAGVRVDAGVGHGCRMLCQGFGAAQADRQFDQVEVVQEREGFFSPPFTSKEIMAPGAEHCSTYRLYCRPSASVSKPR
jgi:hypothetical protein